jgi:nitrogen fixation protein NifU and related proteins
MDRSSNIIDSLYREVILDHHRSPRNFEKLAPVDMFVEGYNPLCGDRIEIYFRAEGEQSAPKLHCAFQGEGCSICMSSASMMTEELNGKSIAETKEWIDGFRQLMRGEKCPLSIEGDLEAIVGVRAFPVRIKCALLPWTTLQDAILKWEQK